MFLILLGIATCDIICYKTAAGVCPENPTKTVTTSETDLAKEIKNDGTIIYTDSALTTTLTDTNIAKVSEIISLLDSNLGATVTLAASVTTPSLTLSGITLTVTPPAGGGSNKLKNGEKLTCTSLVLNKEATVTADTAVIIKDLKCSSIKSGNNAIKLTTGSITLTGDDVIAKVSITSKKVTISDDASSANSAEIPTDVSVAVTSDVTKATATFTAEGEFDTLENEVSVTLNYGNKGKSILTVASTSSSKPFTKPIVNVNTYYKLDSTVTDAIKPIFAFGEGYLLGTGDKRTVPASASYCLDKDFARVSGCPADAQVLWSDDELATISNGDKLINLYISNRNADANIVKLKLTDIKTKSIRFTSVDDTTAQLIELAFDSDDESVSGDCQFNNTKVTALLKKTSTAGKLGFKKLLIRKSEITVKNAASKHLKETPATTLAVSSEDLTTDSSSFNKFSLEKPTKSFSLIDVKSADFKGDGSSVKIDGAVNMAKEDIFTPFTIVVLLNQTNTAVKLSIDKNGNEKGKALPFSFNVQTGSNLEVQYAGDWSSNNIVIANVDADAKFVGEKASDSDVSPSMEYTGVGKAEIDGKPMKKVEPPAGATPTPKGGLSGGAIAGIVIACVVVVAAVVVVVVVVIKKKKGKIAN